MKFTFNFVHPISIGGGKAINEISGEMRWFSFVSMAFNMLLSALIAIVIVDTTHKIKLRFKP
jgi:hypothetical protein